MKHSCLFIVTILLLFCSQTAKAQLENSRLIISGEIRDEALKQTMEKNVSDFLYACNTAVMEGKQPALDKKSTTADGRKRFLDIWKSSPLSCPVSSLERKCLIRPAGGYQIRNIPVTIYEEEEPEQEIVINLTADGKIDDVFVPVNQYTDIISSGEEEDDFDLRQMVLDFVENYRTAYNRKDIKFIETVFSNNAVIIVGKELKQKQKTDAALQSSLSKAQFEYQVKTKPQYIKSLKNIFKKNKYVRVDFDEITVIRHEYYPQVYGVTLKQYWKSAYSDIGYVFLLIDYRDPQYPLIHVRTWQPEMYDGRTLRRDEIFQIGDFPLNKFDKKR